MKNTILALLLALVGGAAVFAIPAYPHKRVVRQPDGSEIAIYGHGDEFCNYVTDAKGYRLERGADGFYRRALDTNGTLLPRNSAPKQRTNALKLQHRTADLLKHPMVRQEGTTPFRGLVLLVNYTDRKFRMGVDHYQKLTGKMGFTGYFDPKYGRINCEGSLRDYFSDNSYGKFDPEFDVVGPIEVDVNQYYPNQVDNAFPLVEKVLAAADTVVDFSKYDSDGDGDVDMFYIIFAGYSSQYGGNNARLLWPFAATMIDESGEDPDIICDGVRLGRFACSTEIYGWQEDDDECLEGIGVMAHEFAHVLGFKDHYDTSGGYQEHPNTWDLMSSGSYNGILNNTPCALNAYEKAAAGFMEPTDISGFDDQVVTLNSIETSEEACVIHSTQEHVHFYLENRQKDKWDKELPHHGMLVWRVDSVIPEYWQYNYVNVSTRTCLRLVRADGTKGDILYGVEDSTTDPFPGTAHVTVLDNTNRVADLLSYDGYPSPVTLEDIAETGNRISFVVKNDSESESRPVTYTVLQTMKASAERLDGDAWVPCEWIVKSGVMLSSTGTEQYVLYNLIPNDAGVESSMHDYSKGVYVMFNYGYDRTTITVNAQRVALEEDRSIWLCNYTDAEASGAGALTFNMNRYGLISLPDPTITLGYVAQSRNAYVINQNKFIERLSTYRNLTFEEVEEGSAIEQTGVPTNSLSGKCFINGRLVLRRDGNAYAADGSALPPHLYLLQK